MRDAEPGRGRLRSQPDARDEELTKIRTDLAERTADLQRLQAEYVNYKRRVDRDRDVSRAAGVESVLKDLLNAVDDIRSAREHEELTGGFKAWSAPTLAAIPFEGIHAGGYVFQIEMTHRANRAGARIVEVPIEFRERELGRSKMSPGIVGEALLKTTAWGLGRRAVQLRGALDRVRRTRTAP